VRRASAIALGKLGDARTMDQLIHMLVDTFSLRDKKELLEEICDALANLGRTASERLLPAFGDEESRESIPIYDFHTYAAKVLGKIGEPRAFEPILFCLEGLTLVPYDLKSEPIARETFLNALRNITHQDFGYNILLWRKWWESNKNLLLKGG